MKFRTLARSDSVYSIRFPRNSEEEDRSNHRYRTRRGIVNGIQVEKEKIETVPTDDDGTRVRVAKRNGRGCFIRVMLIEHAEGPGVLWFARKNNRPSRSLWRHYPVRLESIFSTCCGNDCTPLLTGVPRPPLCRPPGQRPTPTPDRRLPLRYLSLIRLTTDGTQVPQTHARVRK
ncbi:hypothetical protein K0M31_007717 [Melipona bicolor]|uniref:Uncharacterized protein n=1 Tax=Melipona bicolor TaxID=60889 RepID=A0AA40GC87_9HYME|nr:hypothetical protein K0M31_007717 [Melipona bicolor]